MKCITCEYIEWVEMQWMQRVTSAAGRQAVIWYEYKFEYSNGKFCAWLLILPTMKNEKYEGKWRNTSISPATNGC